MYQSPRSTLSTTVVKESQPKDVKLGEYSIRKNKKLGSGAYSAVYLCENKNGKKAAVKILNKNASKSTEIIRVAKT